MQVVTIRWQSVKLLGIFGIASILLMSLLTPGYPALADIEAADLSVLKGKVIAIDPGHGGIDGGAEYGNIKEKDITLGLAAKMGDVLKASGATVVFTRETDLDYYTRGKGGKRNDLLKRIEIINQSGAAIFISIHVNAVNGLRWSGAEVFYNSKLPENKRIAEIMQQVLQLFPPGNKRKSKQDSDILVLKDTNIPGVLIEAGFLSNPKEASLLVNDAYQQKMVQYIAKALAYYFNSNVGR